MRIVVVLANDTIDVQNIITDLLMRKIDEPSYNICIVDCRPVVIRVVTLTLSSLLTTVMG